MERFWEVSYPASWFDIVFLNSGWELSSLCYLGVEEGWACLFGDLAALPLFPSLDLAVSTFSTFFFYFRDGSAAVETFPEEASVGT